MMESYLNTAFNFLSFTPGPFWLMLLLCPKHPTAMKIFDGFLILLSVHFTLLTVPGIPELLPVIASPTFDSISQVLSTPKGILGSWNHMILSDLWIGRWIIYDCLRNEIPTFLRAFVLITTVFFGPLGLSVYLILRFAMKQQWRLSTPGDY